MCSDSPFLGAAAGAGLVVRFGGRFALAAVRFADLVALAGLAALAVFARPAIFAALPRFAGFAFPACFAAFAFFATMRLLGNGR